MTMTFGEVYSFEDQGQLGHIQFHTVLVARIAGQMKLPGFEAFVPQAIPTLIPIQSLDSIPTPVEEDKQIAAQRILVRHRLGRGGQPIKTSSHIRGLHTDKNPNRSPPGQHVAPKRDTRVETPSASKFLRSRNCVRLGRMIS